MADETITEIRTLDRDDAGIFQSIILEALKETPAAFGRSMSDIRRLSLETLTGQLDSQQRGDFMLGAFTNQADLVGIVGFYRHSHTQLQHHGNIWGVYVRQSHRHSGVARALMVEAIERARKLPGIRRIQLSVADNNISAKKLYESLGFRTFAIEMGSLKIGDSYVDEEHMQLFLGKVLL